MTTREAKHTPGPKFRRDMCRICHGDLFVLRWAKRKPRTCHGCAVERRAARAMLAKARQ